jgi:hypothetical protein
MVGYRPSPLFRIGLAVAVLGLLSAFSYPLLQEGYQLVGTSVYRDAQSQMLGELLKEYIQAVGTPRWTTATSTREILTDMSRGVETYGGVRTFLPPSESLDGWAARYRIIYKSPIFYRIVSR